MEDDLRFNVAEGFALLGLRREAMQALYEVPLNPRDREVSELLLDIMAATAKAWAAGEDLARQVQPGYAIRHREGAGRLWMGRAVPLCARGDYNSVPVVLREARPPFR